MILSVILCIASFVLLVILLRRKRISLGLPIAYLFALLFIHVPGAIANIVGGSGLTTTPTEIGIRFTAIAAGCFVIGVSLSPRRGRRPRPRPQRAPYHQFSLFCLVAGLAVTYGLQVLVALPSIGAIVDKGGAVWVLGVLLGLRMAVRQGASKRVVFWLGAMCVYPVLTLLLTGFLSFGSGPVFVILSALVVATQSNWRVAIAVPVVAILFVTLFISYFQIRDEVRTSIWKDGADMATRVDKYSAMVTGLEAINLEDEKHLHALDIRLNQNYFVGRAAERIESGKVDFLYGRSIWEGMIALVPRAVWPSKPVYSGSPGIIREMTGFAVNDTTSFGVGHVMEFYINFGMPSLVIGFLLLGRMFSWLDREAALAIGDGDFGRSIVFFLPAVAMLHPGGSVVELTAGAACAFLAAIGWRWVWERWWGRNTRGMIVRDGRVGPRGRASD